MTPDGGGAPIRFRFFWMSPDKAVTRLGYGMQEGLDLLQCATLRPFPRVCPSPRA
ncbi:hypothetical protein SS05631_c36020 [Sinorhizobium sp. CCBAU 05631]|nr:hypothetical protein SS05631_c36020 [Sinorhizobium sp. CCBAU 05631]